jgi:hypothetical protein
MKGLTAIVGLLTIRLLGITIAGLSIIQGDVDPALHMKGGSSSWTCWNPTLRCWS